MRFKRIDTFRFFAIFNIVWAHCQFFDGLRPNSTATQALELGVILVARYSIQFFFIVSGYFVGGRIIENPAQAKALAWKYTRNLLLLFAAWSLVYAIEDPQRVMRTAERGLLTLLLEGGRVHLWFLPSLALAIWLFALWPFDRKGKSFLLAGGAVFLLGLLGGSYQVAPIGLDLGMNTRDGIFFSMLFFGVGALFSIRKPGARPAAAWGLFAAGFLMFAAEAWYLSARWSALPIRHDYLLGSIPFGIGSFLAAYSAKRETRLDGFLSPVSNYVLGIYVSHPLFLDLWRPLGDSLDPLLWGFLFPLLVFGSALGATILLAKTPLRRFVA